MSCASGAHEVHMDTLPEPLYCEITVFQPVPLLPAEATFEMWHSPVHGESSKCQMGRKPPDNRVNFFFFFLTNTSLCYVWSWNLFFIFFPLNIIAKFWFVEASSSSDGLGACVALIPERCSPVGSALLTISIYFLSCIFLRCVYTLTHRLKLLIN